MKLFIGIVIGIGLTRLFLNPLLQKNAMYLEKEKYLLDKIEEYKEKYGILDNDLLNELIDDSSVQTLST